MKEVVE
jgi:hypothetical protein